MVNRLDVTQGHRTTRAVSNGPLHAGNFKRLCDSEQNLKFINVSHRQGNERNLLTSQQTCLYNLCMTFKAEFNS